MTVQAQLHETLAGLEDVSKQLDKVQSEIDRLLQHQQWLVERKKDLESTAYRLQAECQRERPDVTKSDFPWSKKLHTLKKTTFGIDEFRQLQEQTMNATLSGQDCILVMPTGGGKSLCYQLPALINKGFTLVVSPLVSLMEDQTMSLEQLGINAVLLNAGVPQDRVKLVHQAMIDPNSEMKLIYVTPEKIAKSKRFMAQLEKAYKKGRLGRIAIDEVHCCSQWGHDFRPDYKILGLLKRQFPDTPIMGLTATATNSVLEDVKKILNIQGCVVYRASYNRANLYYQVVAKPSKHTACIEEIVKLLNGKFKNQSGIIYCFSRRESEKVAFDLQALGIKAEPYHADIEVASRSAVHRRWKSNKIQVVVATVAFGMGIDKPDVRFVIHHSLSKSIENYYQESGRAGRDNKRAECIVFFQVSDMFRQSSMVVVEQTGVEKLYNMVAYCISQVKCRRSLLGSHFGERWDGKVACNAMCDNCSNNAQARRTDIQSDCRAIYDILSQAGTKEQRLTANKIADIMQGKTVSGMQLKGSKNSAKIPRSLMEQIIAHLILEGYLKEDFHFTPYSTISYLIPGPRSARVNASQDHPIILKTADPKLKKVAASSSTSQESKNRKTANTSQESKKSKLASTSLESTSQAQGSKNRKTSGTSLESKKNKSASISPGSKKAHVKRPVDGMKTGSGREDDGGKDRNGVVVIDLSDESSDEDVVRQKRKVKMRNSSRIEDDDDDECIVCDEDEDDIGGGDNLGKTSERSVKKSANSLQKNHDKAKEMTKKKHSHNMVSVIN
ncbi:ATP-dependent DNA helicase Q1-like [Amphiura filiformis]|uniref:ATP-dependent DNA helicase Q1-like n=1 Tax=Amphiura filiformis TaxID=82378 RepID=UPI003B220A60